MFNQIRTYDPYRELTLLSRRLFGDIEPNPRPRALVPVDIRDEGDKIVLVADLPGVASDDLEIVASLDRLTIKGHRKPSDDKNTLHRERTELSFERAFHLPKGIELDKVEAKLEAGVLTVSLPKRADEQPRTITIKAA